MATIEIWRWNAVLGAVRGETKLGLKDGLSVWASDAMKSIEEDLEVLVVLEKLLDEREIEDLLQHKGVVLSGVNDLNLQIIIGLGANGLNVDIWNIGNLVFGKVLGSLKDLVGDRLWSWSTVCEVVLDTEVVLWA